MDIQTFDALDQKVTRLLNKMSELQTRNRELETELSELRSDQTVSEQELKDLRQKCASLEENQRDPQREELIRTRISALLEKLETA
ncbi:MAG: cell division protein ZapB [Calditrichaeota bacterium]|nr:cell division protein ZapB [Calditrichota bacterium]MCB9366327.1 cell division protein ZapB [Calditrichota bacterium]